MAHDSYCTDLIDTKNDINSGQGLGDLGDISLNNSGFSSKINFIFPSSSLLANKPNGMATYAGTTPDKPNTFKVMYDTGPSDAVLDTRVVYFTTPNYIYGYKHWGMITSKFKNSGTSRYYLITDETQVP